MAPPVVVEHTGNALAGKLWTARLSETVTAALVAPPMFVAPMV
jgi:hypothetical protein